MITGTINSDLEPIIDLAVLGPTGQRLPLAAVLDTGFTGFLTLPQVHVHVLGLAWLGREAGQLADGSTLVFDVYQASVEWDGAARVVDVQVAEAQPLLGMALLVGSEVRLRVEVGGLVAIQAVP